MGRPKHFNLPPESWKVTVFQPQVRRISMRVLKDGQRVVHNLKGILLTFATVGVSLVVATCPVSNLAAAGQSEVDSEERNRALIRHVLELIDARKLDQAFELYALDYVYHGPDGEIINGRDGIRDLWAVFLAGFPDLHSTVEDLITEGDKLVMRWRIEGTHTGEFLGVAPTGAAINLHVTEIFRIAEGQLVEAWDQYDRLDLMQQIGAIQMPEADPQSG
jgi:steroid delta-isomerase-like uncharacterized protein